MSVSIGGAPAPTIIPSQINSAEKQNFSAPTKIANSNPQNFGNDNSATSEVAPPVQSSVDLASSNGVQLSTEVVTALQNAAKAEVATNTEVEDQEADAAVALGGNRSETSETNLVKGDANAAEIAEAESGDQPTAAAIDSSTGGDSETARNPLNLQI